MFIYEDGHGNMVDDEGEAVSVIEMDVDFETYCNCEWINVKTRQ